MLEGLEVCAEIGCSGGAVFDTAGAWVFVECVIGFDGVRLDLELGVRGNGAIVVAAFVGSLWENFPRPELGGS